MDHKKLQGKVAKAAKRSPVIQALQLTALLVGGAIRQQETAHTSFVSLWL
jgi:heptaprenylglyceryl phosphate synthase